MTSYLSDVKRNKGPRAAETTDDPAAAGHVGSGEGCEMKVAGRGLRVDG